jgi:hypothetical protein
VAIFLLKVSSKKLSERSLEQVLLLFVVGVWLLLFWNNARLLPFHAGFDANEHLKYINYIQENKALPLPNEGWEMYQPPLYYLIGALSLWSCKLSINDPASIVVLRLLGAFFGIAQSVLLFLSLHAAPAASCIHRTLLAAFLPIPLSLGHYVTNEMLSAALATATLYLCLRLLKSDTPHGSQFAWIGLALGATLLTKATGILLLPVVIIAIAGRLAYGYAPLGRSLRNLGLLLAICFAACGWHYARIWLRYGTPLVGNWDAISGFQWWQDPAYHRGTVRNGRRSRVIASAAADRPGRPSHGSGRRVGPLYRQARRCLQHLFARPGL